MQKKHKYFELHEFVASTTAKAKGIDNTPSFVIVEHLDELVEKILDPLRAAWGSSITITSGYRSEALNKAVGGSSTSAHLIGYAADLQVPAPRFNEFKTFVVEWLTKNKVPFDQVLLEKNKSTEWVHVGLKNQLGQQRGQIKIMQV